MIHSARTTWYTACISNHRAVKIWTILRSRIAQFPSILPVFDKISIFRNIAEFSMHYHRINEQEIRRSGKFARDDFDIPLWRNVLNRFLMTFSESLFWGLSEVLFWTDGVVFRLCLFFINWFETTFSSTKESWIFESFSFHFMWLFFFELLSVCSLQCQNLTVWVMVFITATIRISWAAKMCWEASNVQTAFQDLKLTQSTRRNAKVSYKNSDN